MKKTATGLYDDYADARAAVSTLEARGVPSDDISIVSNNADDRYSNDTNAAEGAGTGAGIGAAVGGVGGLLTGLGIMAIPGGGPVVATGWLAATAAGAAAAGAAAGAVAGGAAGGLIGAMTDSGAVSFPFDRMTVQRFRETFPRARWSDRRGAWIVPGKTAQRRIDSWLAKEESRLDPYADEKGRDAYTFEPILSPYLSVDKDGFRISTPYSRKLVEEIRQVPFAHWDGDGKVWRVPFASYDDLVDHWEVIEAEAERSEPEERRKRAETRKGTEEGRKSRRRAAERKRRRIPLPAEDLPPLDRPIATALYGIIVVDDVTGELVESGDVADLYPQFSDDHVWGTWRLPSLDELVHTWPSKAAPTEYERQRGWWLPTIEELRDARRTARSRERRMAAQPPA